MSIPKGPLTLTGSAGIPSEPDDFPVMSLFTDPSIAKMSGGGSYFSAVNSTSVMGVGFPFRSFQRALLHILSNSPWYFL